MSKIFHNPHNDSLYTVIVNMYTDCDDITDQSSRPQQCGGGGGGGGRGDLQTSA